MDQERTYKWIQDRLRELHSGTLSEQDLARLKDIARTDPFVADALEGFVEHPNGEHAQHLQALEQKIRQPRRERRRWLIPNLTVTAIAASVLLIIATYAVISRMEKDSEETLFVFVSPDSLLTADSAVTDIAMEESATTSAAADEEKKEQPIATAKELPAQPTPASRANEPVPSSPAPPAKHDATSVATVSKPPVTAGAAQAVPSATGTLAEDDKTAISDIALSSASETARAKRDEGYYANQMDPDLMQMRVTGLVVDANSSQPVPAAKIAVDYTNQYFYSDIQGYFELSVPEPEAVLQVMQTGYADSLVVVRPGDEHISVGLKTADIIAPIIQHGIKGKGPVSVKKNPAIESHLVFSQYLKAASSLQLTTEPSAARRKVTVTFTVRKDGRPVDVTVVESSRDKTYDDEAVRLIQNGPDWVCPGGEYPCVRRYTFYFR